MSDAVTLLAESLNAIVHHPVAPLEGINYINMMRFYGRMTDTLKAYRTIRVYEADYLRLAEMRERLWKNNKDLRGMILSNPWLFHQMLESVLP